MGRCAVYVCFSWCFAFRYPKLADDVFFELGLSMPDLIANNQTKLQVTWTHIEERFAELTTAAAATNAAGGRVDDDDATSAEDLTLRHTVATFNAHKAEAQQCFKDSACVSRRVCVCVMV